MKKKLVLKRETVVLLGAGMANIRGGEICKPGDNLYPAAPTRPTACIISIHVCKD